MPAAYAMCPEAARADFTRCAEPQAGAAGRFMDEDAAGEYAGKASSMAPLRRNNSSHDSFDGVFG
jgi:hypothetical protein